MQKRTRSPGRSPEEERDRELLMRVARWFKGAKRELPWRTTPRNPWRSLVSEFMLQQTQILRVLGKFEAFMSAFPTPEALSSAEEERVLGAWSGLGYYRRARLLHAAAKEITSRFGGTIPGGVSDLLTLPGVGRYTAGAIASIVFGVPAPLVDGNVARVLLRVHGRELTAPEGMKWSWERAEVLSRLAAQSPGMISLVNEGLMELGGTVCTPQSPRCGACPVREKCRARSRGLQGRIPAPRPALTRTTIESHVIVVRDTRARVLLERRPTRGLWAGLWQTPTLDVPPGRNRNLTPASIRRALGLLGTRTARHAGGDFVHLTSHREVSFHIHASLPVRAKLARRLAAIPPGHSAVERRWVERAAVSTLGISNAQKRILLGVAPG